MPGLFRSVFKGRNDKDVSFQKALTGGFLSRATTLVNDTDQILYFRDKVGSAYGTTRYKIPPRASLDVMPSQHTFFKLLVYAVPEKDAAALNSKSRVTSTDTSLTIDSDQITDYNKVKISCNGEQYKVSFT